MHRHLSPPPINPAVVDLHDPTQLAVMYQWAGSARTLARVMREAGRPVSSTTIDNWRREHNIPVADPGYRYRSARYWAARETVPETTGQTPDPASTIESLVEYLTTRVVPEPPSPSAEVTEGGYATCLVASDLHFPFHHEGAFEVFLGLAERIRPAEIVLDGDVFDFAQIGRYIKDPRALNPIENDIEQCRLLLERIRVAAPRAVRRFIVGNHEEARWRNYLLMHCPEIAGLPMLTMEAVLGLTELGWAWQPYEYWVTDQLVIYHGDRHTNSLGGGSALSARKESIDMGCSTVTGHTHHAGAFFRQDRMGYRVSYEIGGLMDWRKMQAAGVTTRRTPTKVEDWHLACAVIRYRPNHSAFRVELIPILEDGERTFAIWQDEEISS